MEYIDKLRNMYINREDETIFLKKYKKHLQQKILELNDYCFDDFLNLLKKH